MFQGLTGWHLIIILVIVLLLFGAPKLPALARSLGQSMRIFKGEVKEMQKDGETPAAGQAPSTSTDSPNTQPPAAGGSAPEGGSTPPRA